MSIDEGQWTTINIRVMEHCDWINLERKKYDAGKQDEIEMISHWYKISERHNFFSYHAFEGTYSWQSMDSPSLSEREEKLYHTS